MGDTFGFVLGLIWPLDLSQDSTAILQADSIVGRPEVFIVYRILSTFSIIVS